MLSTEVVWWYLLSSFCLLCSQSTRAPLRMSISLAWNTKLRKRCVNKKTGFWFINVSVDVSQSNVTYFRVVNVNRNWELCILIMKSHLAIQNPCHSFSIISTLYFFLFIFISLRLNFSSFPCIAVFLLGRNSVYSKKKKKEKFNIQVISHSVIDRLLVS